MSSFLQGWIRKVPKQAAARVGLLVVAGALVFLVLESPIALRPTSFPLQIGDVAPQDIQASFPLSFQSDSLTQQARTDAANAVAPVYLPADPTIARKQIERLRVALNFISSVRADTYATQAQKLGDLAQLTDIHLSAETATLLLSMSDTRWQEVQQEAISVLEEVMRNQVREDRLSEVVRSVPTLISFSLTQEQATLVSELDTPLIVPNSIYSAEQTDAARKSIVQSISPVVRSFVANETIVRRGQVITPAIYEVLEKYGLVRPQTNQNDILAAAALVLLATGFTGLYFYRRNPEPNLDMRSILVITGAFLLFLFGARYIIPNRTVIPYLYPLPAFGLTIAALFNPEIGLVLSLVLSILSAFSLPNSLDLTLFYALSSLCGVLALGRAHRIANFFWAGIVSGVAGIAVVVAYRLNGSTIDWIGIATLFGASLLNGLASGSLALIIQFLFSQVLGITTALQLLEVSRPDHPLLQFLLRNAPGTYQHSLQVANLASQAAEEIGADGLLTRVGAIYHDAGKALNSSFFIENQVRGELDSHDALDPGQTAQTIIRHVADGIGLAHRYRLPPQLCDFMREHHGTLLTRYQYNKALELAGDHPGTIDATLFRYPGPRPQSREAALIMLADGCEARARGELPKTEGELRDLIRTVFEICQHEGQLDDTRLTLQDLSVAANSFAATLRGIYHPRIPYPERIMGPSVHEIPTSPLPSSAPIAALPEKTSPEAGEP